MSFFSFVGQQKHGTDITEYFYFDAVARLTERKPDSHSNIVMTLIGSTTQEDRCNKFEFINGKFIVDSQTYGDAVTTEDARLWVEKFSKTKKFQQILDVTIDNITRDLEDPDVCVRYIAIQHPNVTVDHITQALKDTDWCVYFAAQEVLDERKSA